MCVCVCMYVGMYVCMYVCMCMCVHRTFDARKPSGTVHRYWPCYYTYIVYISVVAFHLGSARLLPLETQDDYPWTEEVGTRAVPFSVGALFIIILCISFL
ncbi:hypothetical protein F4809DRAFT_494444 [Biscogniauxia mediterranea]|nr:hypothetical protein F4809DRAFT_494444 [Biscogniauxia mediterranea]